MRNTGFTAIGGTVAQWEYKIVVRGRDLHRPITSGFTNSAADDTRVKTDFMPSGNEMLETLGQLGREEWELVAITTRASQHNSPMTTEEIWVFKRAIQ